MRPLELRLAGFRSYRAQRTIDFRGLDIIAIIGDTGAGKSSILEAMTWALYGASTWSKRSASELLAHGANRMSVALVFEAAGEHWQVTRTYSRSGAPTAELACLSNSGIAKVDGVRQVDPEVERILGLSYDVFCSCVLLPQGKFERLLKATPGEKTATLRSILRLEQLTEARVVAERQAGIVAERERELIVARGRFRPDPAADVGAAEAELARLRPQLEAAQSVSNRLAELATTIGASEAAERDAAGAGRRLGSRRGGHAETVRSLLEPAARSSQERAKARTSLQQADERLTVAEADLAAAEHQGLDHAALTMVANRLEVVAQLLARRSQLDEAVEGAERYLVTAQIALGDARGRSQASALALEKHDAATSVATEHQCESDAAWREASEIVGMLDAAVAHEQEAITQRNAAAQGAGVTAGAATDAAAALDLAEQRWRDANEACERQRRTHAAAHAAAGSRPGDPCPVCVRPLQAEFVAIPVPDLGDAESKLAEADEARMRATHDAAGASAAAQAGASTLAGAEAAVQERKAATLAASAAATRMLRLDDATDTTVALGAFEAAATTAKQAVTALAEERIALARAQTETAAAAAAAESDVVARKRDLDGRREDRRLVGGQIDSVLAELPGLCELPVDPLALGPADLAAAEARVAVLAEEAKALQHRRDDARSAREQAGTIVAALELAHERDVMSPMGAARAGLRTLAIELLDTGDESVPDEPNGDDVEALAAWAAAVDGRVEAQILSFDAQVVAARQARECAEEETGAVLADAGVSDTAELGERLDDLRGRVRAVERDRVAAAEQVEDAARLSGLVAQAANMRVGFEALKDALNDSAFVRFVVTRRQRALLAHASRVLEDITGRYAFTDDFRILDRDSGLPRSPDTLSGGETFIASLALALGLVEVADRSGGDLRALFLDEGFGTLDATILDTALTALEERAKAGRLIGIISHVPTVAERIDTVIEVRNALEGSAVTVLSSSERDGRVLGAMSEEVGRRLI